MGQLAIRVARLEHAGTPCAVCHGRYVVQRGDAAPPVRCGGCGAAPLVIVVRRVPGREA
jgi:hypothetical protein